MNQEIFLVPSNGRVFLKTADGKLVGTKQQRSYGFKTRESASAARSYIINSRERFKKEYQLKRGLSDLDKHLDSI